MDRPGDAAYYNRSHGDPQTQTSKPRRMNRERLVEPGTLGVDAEQPQAHRNQGDGGRGERRLPRRGLVGHHASGNNSLSSTVSERH